MARGAGAVQRPRRVEHRGAVVQQVAHPVAVAVAIIGSDEYAPEVRAEQHFWLRSGINSVPSVVVNRRHLIQGAQPPEVFEQALRQVAAEG